MERPSHGQSTAKASKTVSLAAAKAKPTAISQPVVPVTSYSFVTRRTIYDRISDLTIADRSAIAFWLGRQSGVVTRRDFDAESQQNEQRGGQPRTTTQSTSLDSR